MKVSLFFVVCAMILPIVSQAEIIEEVEPQKTYLEPSQIAFVDRGIFAYIKGDWIPVETISVDANGLFAIHKDDPNHGRHWICPRCRYNNSPANAFCQNWLYNDRGRYQCLYPRPQ